MTLAKKRKSIEQASKKKRKRDKRKQNTHVKSISKQSTVSGRQQRTIQKEGKGELTAEVLFTIQSITHFTITNKIDRTYSQHRTTAQTKTKESSQPSIETRVEANEEQTTPAQTITQHQGAEQNKHGTNKPTNNSSITQEKKQ